MNHFSLYFVITVTLVKSNSCYSACVEFQGGVFSSNKFQSTKGFLNCSFALPCVNSDLVSVQSIQIYRSTDQLLASVGESQSVVIKPAGKEINVEAKSSVTNNVVSYLSLHFEPTKLETENYFECMVRAKSKSGKIYPFIASNYLNLAENCNKANSLNIDLQNASRNLFFNSTILNYKGHIYYLSIKVNTSSEEASHFCNVLGGYLAEVESRDEYTAVVRFLQEFTFNDTIMVAGTDAVEESKWIFQRSGKPVEFFDWLKDEPNNLSDEDCLSLRHVNSGIKMNDIACSGKRNFPLFLCEVE